MAHSGSRVLSKLRNEVKRSRGQLGKLDSGIQRQLVDLTGTRNELAVSYRKLAGFYLEEIDAQRLGARFDDTFREVANLLDQRDRQQRNVNASLTANEQLLEQVQSEQASRGQARDEAAAALEDKIIATREVLLDDRDFLAIREQWHASKARHAQVTERLGAAVDDRDAKRKPYDNDRIFSYLWARRYGTEHYRSRGLVRLFDGWLREFVDYDNSSRNFQLLLAIPDRLEQHAESLRREIAALAEQLDQAFESRLAADGGGSLRQSLADAEQTLQKSIAETARLGGESDQLARTLAGFEQGIDQYSATAMQQQRDQFAVDPLPALWQRARSTPSGADDRLVTQIDQLRRQEVKLERHLLDRRGAATRLRERLAELQAVELDFTRKDWDSRYSSFGRRLDIGWLVASVLQGKLDRHAALKHLRRHQRFRDRRGSTWSGGFPGSRGGRGRSGGGGFGGGGFSGGGGFGGSGFSTGGGF